MTDDPMAADRKYYDDNEFDATKMRRAPRPATPDGPKSVFNLRLEGRIIDQISQAATAEGIGPSQLVRKWILERLDQQTSEPTALDDVVAAITTLKNDADRALQVARRLAG